MKEAFIILLLLGFIGFLFKDGEKTFYKERKAGKGVMVSALSSIRVGWLHLF